MDFGFMLVYYPYFVDGAISTLALAAFTIVFGVVIGTIIAMLKQSGLRLLRIIAASYVEFVRGTPLLVQLFIFYFGIPIDFPDVKFLGMDLDRFIPGVIALSINSGAYISEIIRAGIQAVDKGQFEAARSLGFNYFQTMRYIILPQAVRNILPALGNEFVVVIKESSMASIIGISELMFSASVVRGATYRPIEPYLVTAVIYFLMTFTVSKILGVAERRMRAGA